MFDKQMEKQSIFEEIVISEEMHLIRTGYAPPSF